MKKNFLALVLISFSFLLSGCWDLNENERMYYIHGMGIDFKDGKYEIYPQIISFSNVAKSEQVNQDVIQSEVTTFKGVTVGEAFSNFYNAIDEEVYWGHFTFLIFSTDALKDNRANSFINEITRFSETRYHTWVYATDEPLAEFLTNVPLLRRSITLTRLADPLNSYEQQSFIEPTNIRRMIIKLNEPNHLAIIPYVKLKEGWENQKDPSNTIETAGAAILTKKKFEGYVKGQDAAGLKWLSKETISARVTSKFENNRHISATITEIQNNVEPIINGNDVKFDINISFQAALGSFTGDLKPKEIEEALTKEIKKEVRDTFKIGLEKKVDIYRLSEVLYRKNVKVYKKLEKDGQIELAEDSIRKININVDKVETGRKSFEDTIE